jgi:hypothetical protein
MRWLGHRIPPLAKPLVASKHRVHIEGGPVCAAKRSSRGASLTTVAKVNPCSVAAVVESEPQLNSWLGSGSDWRVKRHLVLCSRLPIGCGWLLRLPARRQRKVAGRASWLAHTPHGLGNGRRPHRNRIPDAVVSDRLRDDQAGEPTHACDMSLPTQPPLELG